MDKTYEVRAKPSYCMACKICNKRKPTILIQVSVFYLDLVSKISLNHHPWNTSLVPPSKFVVVLSNNALQMA
jgi:hypothetical protein